MTDIAPHSLTTAGRVAPLGIDDPLPEFGWKLGDVAGQAAYEIEVRPDNGAEPVWTSGWVDSSEPFGARYEGRPLISATTYRWRVRVRRDDGSESAWSDSAVFETGLLNPAEWRAEWISAPAAGKNDRRALYFRRGFQLAAPVRRARAYVSALGWYRLCINGVEVNPGELVPRWTPIHRYVEYQVYDVTEAFSAGANAVGLTVADGRFRGHLGVFSRDAQYGDRLAVIASIELELENGAVVTVATDRSWTVGTGRIATADPKTGERVDLRISDTEFSLPGGRLAGGSPAQVLDRPGTRLIAEEVERVREIDRVGAKSVVRTPSGAQLFDFGQNFTGVAQVQLPAGSGHTVVLKYGEVLTPAGELDEHYLGAKPKVAWFQRDEAILASVPVEYTPRFTIHGFQYLAIEGLDEDIALGDVEGIVLSSDLKQISEFVCSDARLNQLWQNVHWSLRSNFTDTATDCPTRERSGWTGDIQIFGPTAAQMIDAGAFLRRYLRNLATDQYKNGRVPPFIPAEDSPGHFRNPLRIMSGSVGFGDVATLLPWALYEYLGDREVLRRQYDSSRKWVDLLARRARWHRGWHRWFVHRQGAHERFIVDSGLHWGEWLRPGETTADAFRVITGDNSVIATAYLAQSAAVLSKMAGVLDMPADRDRYAELAGNVRSAWNAAFVRDGGRRIGGDRQEDYVRALAFDLIPAGARAAAAGRLVELVEAAGDHLGTGFFATPLLLSALSDAGHEDVAMRVLLQTEDPSWLAQIARGATTTWETWEGYGPTGNARDSHNHYALGSVARFLQERVAGLAPLEAGYRRIRVAPIVNDTIDSARVAVDTPFGMATVSWRRLGDEVELDATIPAGTTAVVGPEEVELTAGDHRVTWSLAADTEHRPQRDRV